jgi:hypothetical protein
MRPIEAVLERAGHAREAGTGWLVSCPILDHGQGRGTQARAWIYASNVSTAAMEKRPSSPPQSSTATTTRRKHGCAPAVAYLGAVEPVLERLYGRGEVTM